MADSKRATAIRQRTLEITKHNAEMQAAIDAEFEEYFELKYQSTDLNYTAEDMKQMRIKLLQKQQSVSDHLENSNKELNAVQDCLSLEKEDFQKRKLQMESTVGDLELVKKNADMAEQSMSMVISIENERELLKSRLAEKLKKLRDKNAAMRIDLEVKAPILPNRDAIQTKIAKEKKEIKVLKKEFRTTDAEVKRVVMQVEQKRAKATLQRVDTARKKAHMNFLKKKLKGLNEKKFLNTTKIATALRTKMELEEKNAQLQKEVEMKQANRVQRKAKLMEVNQRLKTSIEVKKKKIDQKNEELEKLRKRRDELKEILKDGALKNAERKVEVLADRCRVIQEDNLLRELELLQCDMENSSEVSSIENSNSSVLAWLESCDQTIADQDFYMDGERSPTDLQGEDNFDLK